MEKTASKQSFELLKAVNFAAGKHTFQRRKDQFKSPYINHPIEVAYILSDHGVTDVNVLQAAVLHDTIEDTETKKQELVENFGEKVTSIVLECSDDKTLDKVTRKRLQLQHALHASLEARLVKLADKYSNCQDLATNPPVKWSPREIYGYMVWSFAMVSSILGTLPSLEKKLYDLFKSFGINTDMSQQELILQLEDYYLNIKNSE